jgi:hypothetical protein
MIGTSFTTRTTRFCTYFSSPSLNLTARPLFEVLLILLIAAPVKDVLGAFADDLGLLPPRVPMKEALKGDDEGELMIGRIRHNFPRLE